MEKHVEGLSRAATTRDEVEIGELGPRTSMKKLHVTTSPQQKKHNYSMKIEKNC